MYVWSRICGFTSNTKFHQFKNSSIYNMSFKGDTSTTLGDWGHNKSLVDIKEG